MKCTRWFGLGLLAPMALMAATSGPAAAQVIYIDIDHHPDGIHITPQPQPPPNQPQRLSLRRYRGRVTITDGVAETLVQQTFHNPLSRQIEGRYVFPIPPGAAVQDFRLEMNGRMVKGEVLDRAKAREVYESIVRRRRDPGLLEYIGYGLIQATIFPVPARQDIDVSLTYSELLEKKGDELYAFSQPLAACMLGGIPEQVVVTIDLRSQVPLKTIYSPTHDVEVLRDGDRHAKISFEGGRTGEKDFKLYYSRSAKEFGLTLLANRRPGQDGHFAMMIAPDISAAAGTSQPKDIVFVVDTSGSMQGEKITQAKKSLRYCLQALDKHDRFSVVPFSTESRPLTESLVEANEENVRFARSFVDKLEAAGGTNIHDALIDALRLNDHSGNRLFQILFLTDGLPTVAVTEPKQIMRDFRKANADNVRLFALGVGHDVNTFLLDKLAEENRGSRDYVSPGENLEVKVSGLYARIAKPALIDPRITVDGVEIHDLQPPHLGDIFHGTDLIILGRYRGDGNHAVRLTGRQGGVEKTWTFEATFPSVTADHDFLPRLWATRKVGYLLDQIRLHGSNDELVGEIVRLGKKYSIVTPYTSNLVVEDGELAAMTLDATRSGGVRRLFGVRARAQEGLDRDTVARLAELGYTSDGAQASGKKAVEGSVAAGRLATARLPATAIRGGAAGPGTPVTGGNGLHNGRPTERPGAENNPANGHVREVAGHIFYLIGNTWTDQFFLNARTKLTTVEIKAFSEEYFKLVREKPDLRRFLALGSRVVVVRDDVVYHVTD